MNLLSIILDLNEILKAEYYSRELLLSKYHNIYEILRKSYHHNAALLLSLKIINILVGKYERAKKKVLIQNRPYGLVVDPSNGCNLHCPGCVHSLSTHFDWPNGILKQETYENFLDIYAPYACYAFLYNYGEPFLNPLTPNLIKRSKDYLLNVIISSNLSIPKLDCKSIVESKLDRLTVSIDGVSQEVYSKYRKNGNIDIVFENLQYLILEKKETGSTRPYIVWQYLVFEHNSHEMDSAKKIAVEIGVDELHFARPYSVSWDDPSILIKRDFQDEHIVFKSHKSYLDEDIQALSKNNKTHFEFSLFHNLIPKPAHKKEDITDAEECSFLYTTITMDANSRILPCCAAPNESMNLVFDRFLGNNYSYNNEFFVEARKNAYVLSGGESNGSTLHCYYCSYRGPGLMKIPGHLRSYLFCICDNELDKCVDDIVFTEIPIIMKIKAIYRKIDKAFPKLARFCKGIYKKVIRIVEKTSKIH